MIRATALAAAVLLVGCGDQAPYACSPLTDGVDVVANEGTGRWAREGLSPRIDDELWRRGGTREGEELSLPTFPAVSPGGRFALPDFRLAECSTWWERRSSVLRTGPGWPR